MLADQQESMLLGSKHLSYEHKSKQFQKEVDMKIWEEWGAHDWRVDKLLFSPENIIVGCSIAQIEDGPNFRISVRNCSQ